MDYNSSALKSTKSDHYPRTRIFAGNNLRSGGGQTVWVDTVHREPRYLKGIRRHDIALYKLNRQINFTDTYNLFQYKAQTICLPASQPIVGNAKVSAVMFGWGLMYSKPGEERESNVLQRGEFVVQKCGNLYCSKYNRKQQTARGCKGDSGGGLVQYIDKERTRAVLIGINAYLKGSNECDTNLTQAQWVPVIDYIQWIRDTIANN
ncbi:unnamed protein product [Medioppia subpectinata]|uniref:Peptidase S1 domain-containing protein n=1 Tax=Medioppia subpectinata TaxID=1979941 RepID=A0A7R9Q8N6_9ACAR|nr:unnamed protein product [Medioppia subpectinata]CAG2115536.1 unnamed protein product [Medioppia subpectinata]